MPYSRNYNTTKKPHTQYTYQKNDRLFVGLLGKSWEGSRCTWGRVWCGALAAAL